jgi:hypothetical protein
MTATTKEMRVGWPVALAVVCACLLVGCQADHKNGTTAVRT